MTIQRSKKAFLGAGGGGDSLSALLLAIDAAESGQDAVAIGVGNHKTEYERYLDTKQFDSHVTKAVPTRKGFDKRMETRLGVMVAVLCSLISGYWVSFFAAYTTLILVGILVYYDYEIHSLAAYLDSVATFSARGYFQVNPYVPTPYQLECIGPSPYNALMEEASYMAGLPNPNQVPLLMLQVAGGVSPKYTGVMGQCIGEDREMIEMEIAQLCTALYHLVVDHGIDQLDVFDGGADAVYELESTTLQQTDRDKKVLIACIFLKLCLPSVCVRLIMYAPGADAHAPPTHIVQNLEKHLGMSKDDNFTALFANLLRVHEPLLKTLAPSIVEPHRVNSIFANAVQRQDQTDFLHCIAKRAEAKGKLTPTLEEGYDVAYVGTAWTTELDANVWMEHFRRISFTSEWFVKLLLNVANERLDTLTFDMEDAEEVLKSALRADTERSRCLQNRSYESAMLTKRQTIDRNWIESPVLRAKAKEYMQTHPNDEAAFMSLEPHAKMYESAMGVNLIPIRSSLDPPDRINLFYKDLDHVEEMLDALEVHRETHVGKILEKTMNMICRSAEEEEDPDLKMDYINVHGMMQRQLAKVQNGENYEDLGISVRVFCQTWDCRHKDANGEGRPARHARFSVPSPHFQTFLSMDQSKEWHNMFSYAKLVCRMVDHMKDEYNGSFYRVLE